MKIAAMATVLGFALHPIVSELPLSLDRLDGFTAGRLFVGGLVFSFVIYLVFQIGLGMWRLLTRRIVQ
jgi:hypothetical protein